MISDDMLMNKSAGSIQALLRGNKGRQMGQDAKVKAKQELLEKRRLGRTPMEELKQEMLLVEWSKMQHVMGGMNLLRFISAVRHEAKTPARFLPDTKLKQLFDYVDHGKTGKITYDMLCDWLMDAESWRQKLANKAVVDLADPRTFFNRHDGSGDGKLDLDEFIAMLRADGQVDAEEVPDMALETIFNSIDADNS